MCASAEDSPPAVPVVNLRQPGIALTIAGSDPCAGAGLQADLKTFAAHGIYGVAAVTALTVQNTRGVLAVDAVSPRRVGEQIRALLGDFDLAAIKIGMLGSAGVARAVARELDRASRVPVVLDPVLKASRGAALLDKRGLDVVRRELVPRAAVLTPNLPEASILLGRRVRAAEEMADAAAALRALGARAVLIKGGHLESDRLVDLWSDENGVRRFRHARLAVLAHGTGCALSSALAARLARGEGPVDAARGAVAYVRAALRGARRLGRGPLELLDHFAQTSG